MASRMRVLGKSVSILAIRVILVVLILFAMISTVVWLSYSGAAMFVNYEPNATKVAGMAFLLTIVTVVVGISGIIFAALYKSRYTQEEK
jgi:polyferredoxin